MHILTVKTSRDRCYFVFVSMLMWARVCSSEAMCPEACDCLSNYVRICTNVTSLGDILENSRLVEELTLIHLQDLNGINDHFGASFESTRRLKIRQSFISTVSESFVFLFPNVESVILENNQFECSEKILPLRVWKSKIEISSDNLNCSSPDGFYGEPIFLALKTISRANKDCPKPCRCTAKSLQISHSIPNLHINCSHSNLNTILTSLPTHPWVIELDLSHNLIEDISLLKNHPAYRNVPVINLAYNNIHNVHIPANASTHKNHFRLLNLANNKLTQLPVTLMFDNESFFYQPLIMLRNNPWVCDCNSVKNFQSIAMQQLQIIGDYFHLTCGGDLYEGQMISSPAFLQKLCSVPVYGMAIMTIRCVNACCFILVGVALIKTAFDLRSMYAVGIFHFYAHLLLPSR